MASSTGYFTARPGPSRLPLGDVKIPHDDDQDSVLSSPRSLATRRSIDSPPLSEIEPLLLEQNHHTAPPPAYEHSQYEHFLQQPSRVSYGTTPNPPFFEERQPQSIALPQADATAEAAEDAYDGQSRHSRNKRNRRSRRCARWLKLLAIVLIVFAISSILWKVLHKTNDGNVRSSWRFIPSGLINGRLANMKMTATTSLHLVVFQ